VANEAKVAGQSWVKARGEGGADVSRALVAAFHQGRAAWPALEVSLEGFVTHVARVSDAGLTLAELEGVSGEGLYLCAACVSGDVKAHALFDSVFLEPLLRVIGKLDGGRELAKDVLQDVRAQFFSPRAGQASAFFAYSGRGALAVWLKVLAVRAAQKHRRGAARNAEVPDDGLATLPASDADPELRFLKLQHRQHFKAVFAEALASLESRERSVLRMSLVEGLSIDDIGKVYDVHRATAARWLGQARERLVQDTRHRLAARLKVDDDELDEVMGAVQSHLSISLGAGLASKGPSRR
jgi:RNA polymerase sigma-70 factor, ECF subfamily